jgi:glycosyltransferase involved in cell wall biosynthesis
MKRTVSVIVPAYNEEDCVEELALRLTKVFSDEDQYEFEVFFVENGSTDSTWHKLQQISSIDARFKVIKLSRNFRMDGGLTAGLHVANGDACVLMAADLQDPPEMISDFLREWEKGWENIYGVVTKRGGTGPIRSFNSHAFYWLAGRLTDGRIPKNASDFRLVDRRVYETVRGMSERNRFVRGLFAWVGFQSIGIPFERPPRFGGVSNAKSFAVLDLALKGIFAHSYKPLKLMSLFGLVLSGCSLIAIMAQSIWWLSFGVPFAGFGTLVSLILFAVGIQSFMFGIMAEYIGMIYEEVKGRPNFVISETIGIVE